MHSTFTYNNKDNNTKNSNDNLKVTTNELDADEILIIQIIYLAE